MIKNYVGGAWRDASATDSLAVMNPASGEEIGRVPLSTATDMAAAVPAGEGERVFEPGAGTGAAALCLARRVEG